MFKRTISPSGQGFTLLELLIVIALISIIVALAVPRFTESKRAGNEAAAISYMKHWVSAQQIYHNKYGYYADADEQLFNEGLIGVADSDAHGYKFSLDNPPGSQDLWWGTGQPEVPGRTGVRYFYIDNSAVLRYSTAGPADGSSTPLGK